MRTASIGPPQILQFFNNSFTSFEYVDASFSHIAEAMTVHIRQSGVQISNFSSGVQGVMLSEQTCVAIRWPWLAFPAALVVPSILLFMGVIFRATPKRLHTKGWKSSPLPPVFHGLDVQDVGKKKTGGMEIQAMEEKAKSLLVQIHADGEGWGFTETNSVGAT